MAGQRAALSPGPGGVQAAASFLLGSDDPGTVCPRTEGSDIAVLMGQSLVSEYRTDIGAKPFLFLPGRADRQLVHAGLPDGDAGRRGP